MEFIRDLADTRPGISGHADTHELSCFFHFAAGLTLRWIDFSESVMAKGNGKPYVMVFPPKGAYIEIKSDRVSRSYESKELNPMLHGIWKGDISNSSVNFCWKFVSVTKKIVR